MKEMFAFEIPRHLWVRGDNPNAEGRHLSSIGIERNKDKKKLLENKKPDISRVSLQMNLTNIIRQARHAVSSEQLALPALVATCWLDS